MENEKEAFQFYWCVYCGHHGDYGRPRKTRLSCQNCGQDEVGCLYTQEDIDEDLDLRYRKFLRKNNETT